TTYSTKSFSEWHDFGLTEADGEHDVTRGLHIAFSAPSREQVDGFWQVGVDAGYIGDGPPGPRPHYREDYYGAFLRDPTGNSIEAGHRGNGRPGERPRYHPGYYAAYVVDPDGNNIEVVNHHRH